MLVQPYLFFEGRAEEAADFYREVLGAELTAIMRFKDNPDPSGSGMVPPGAEDKVLHMSMRIGDTIVMGSDGFASGKPKFEGFAISLTVTGVEEAEKLFDALSKGGKVTVPLAKTFFATRFGMVNDKFGVSPINFNAIG